MGTICRFSFVIFACLCLFGVTSGQQQPADSLESMTESEIVLEVGRISQNLFSITSDLNRGAGLDNIQRQYEDFKPELSRYLEIGREQVATSGINRIQDLILIMQRHETRIDEWQEQLLGISEALNGHLEMVNSSLEAYGPLLRDRGKLSVQYNEHLEVVYSQLQDTKRLLEERKSDILELQIDIADSYVKVIRTLNDFREFRARYWERLMQPDTIGYFIEPTEDLSPSRLGTTVWRIVEFFRIHPMNTTVFILMIVLIYYLLLKIKRHDKERKFPELYSNRYAIAPLLALLLIPFIFPPTTSLMSDFMLVVAYVPFLVVLRKEPFRGQFFSYISFLAVYLIIKLAAFYIQSFSAWLQEIIYLGAAAMFMAFLLNKRQYRAFDPKWKIATALLWLLKILLVVATICFFTNRKILSRILIEGVGDTIALGMVVLYLGFWFDRFVDFLKANPKLIHMQSENKKFGWEMVKNYIRFVLIVIFLVSFLHYFHVADSIEQAVLDFLNADRGIGSITFNYMGILLFVVVIIISSKLAGWVRYISEGKSYYGSVKKTSTIATMLRFGIILVGFLIALFLSGIPLDKITIILGALSVGLGFGLQNIVNNLVSGIILIFERPVQTGDFVDVRNYSGIIKEIGIRASVLRTFDGAEVIIPNGQLISEEVINWTLSNRHRRVEINVGVAYGSNVKQVKAVLENILENYQEILRLPRPVVLFNELGESSLNFSMRFWVINIDDWFDIKSDLTEKVYDELNKANIGIPFPQRDLHIKSMSIGELKKEWDSVRKNEPDI